VLLTVSGLRRYPLSQLHLSAMPGRGLITFLIVANVTVWICRTALVKAISLDTMIDYYTTLPWLLVANINLPLLLFYRFHSSFCLADIWHSAYTYPAASSDHHGGGGGGGSKQQDRAPTNDKPRRGNQLQQPQQQQLQQQPQHVTFDDTDDIVMMPPNNGNAGRYTVSSI